MNELSKYLSSLNKDFLPLTKKIRSLGKKLKPKKQLIFIEPSRDEASELQTKYHKEYVNLMKLSTPELEKEIYDNPELVKSINSIMYNSAMTINLLDSYIWIKNNTLADNFEGIIYCIDKGLLVQSLILVRAAIEQIADVVHFSKQCDSYLNNQDPIASEILFLESLNKKTMAQRIDWNDCMSKSLRKGEKKEYKSTENFVNLKAESILNSIDYLDKKLNGIRKSYELLCEFAHPNVGPYLIYRSIRKLDTKSKLRFTEKILNNSTPSNAMELFSTHLFELYELLYEAGVIYQESNDKIKEVKKNLRSNAKDIAKTALNNWEIAWSIDEPCICLSPSRKSIGECCGKNIKRQ